MVKRRPLFYPGLLGRTVSFMILQLGTVDHDKRKITFVFSRLEMKVQGRIVTVGKRSRKDTAST